MWITPSLLLIPGLLCLVVVIPVRVPCMGQLELLALYYNTNMQTINSNS